MMHESRRGHLQRSTRRTCQTTGGRSSDPIQPLSVSKWTAITMNTRCVLFPLLSALLILSGFFFLPAGFAATITVNSVADNTTGSDASCTLREAVENANNDSDTTGGDCTAGSGADTIQFDTSTAGSTINLSEIGSATYGNSSLAITSEVIITGPSDSGIALDASTQEMRILYVNSSGDLSLSDLTLTGGNARGGNGGGSYGGQGGGGAGMGGAIFVNEGTVNIQRVTLTGNQAIGGAGRTPTSGFCGSASGGGPNGGSAGSPNFTSNGSPAGDGGDGGFGGGGGGGGCAYGGEAGDGGDGGFGGGGGSGGGNNGGGGTPGAYGQAGVGGEDGSTGTDVSGGTSGDGAGYGGAIFNKSGTVTVRNSTLSGNTAEAGGAGASSGGGAIFNYNGNLLVVNCTVNNNTAAQGGGIGTLGDAATAIAIVRNTIIANSPPGVNDFMGGPINGGTSTTLGVGNLMESHFGFSGTVAYTTDPNLNPLADNGGPTQTHSFAGPSDAIDGGNNAFAASLTTDQRGYVPRIVNGTVDIGAYEEGAAAPAQPSRSTPGINLLLTSDE